MPTTELEPQVETIFGEYEKDRSNLIPILQEAQELEGYLSRDALEKVADYLDLSLNDVFGVASFYTLFKFIPPGRCQVKVCQGTACHVRGSSLIMEELCDKLGIKPGETTADRAFSLESVACYGSCALAPVMIVDEKVHSQMTTKTACDLVDESG